MDQDRAVRNLYEALLAAIRSDEGVREAIEECERAGMVPKHINVEAHFSLSEYKAPDPRTDAEFLRMLRIVPDLEVPGT